MLIIPAIDLRKGRCVRLVRGDIRDETVYSREPVAMAKFWEMKGAKWLHVVDLDGALTGEPQNLKFAYEMVKKLGIPVEFGGGVRDFETLKAILDHGLRRVILGTSACQDRKFLDKALSKYGSRVVVGVDARDSLVAINGWKDTSKKKAVEFAREMEGAGAKTLIVTDIKKDGMLTGPNFKLIKEVAQAVKIPVVASGGVTTLKDIRHMCNLEKYGVEGLIVGKALYTGDMDLKDAIKVASGEKEVAMERPRKRKG